MKSIISFLIVIIFSFNPLNQLFAQTSPLKADSVKAESGCISGDCENGIGKIIYNDGDIYEGYFMNTLRHGFGLYEYIEGDVYAGMWEKGKRNGLGHYIWLSGNEYVGFWIADQQNGLGTKFYKDGTNEAGEWEKGVFKSE